MTEINTLDIKGIVSSAVNEVFDTMLSMDVEPSDSDSGSDIECSGIVGAVSFAGEVVGFISIHMKNDFARIATAAMLGLELEELEGEEEVHDVIGEMSNMIGGCIKSRFCDTGLPCELSIPTITSGNEFKIGSMNWTRSEHFVFHREQHMIMMRVYIKPSDNLLTETGGECFMSEINALDLKGFVSHAVSEMFDKMLSMQVQVSQIDALKTISGNRIVGSVSFAGQVMGNISIQVPHDFARVMTAAMLGMELEEVKGEEEVHDVIGEVSNMVGGSMKSRFCDSGLPCELSIPTIMSGNDFKVESMDWVRSERFVFSNQQYSGIVEVFIRGSN